MKLIKKIKMKKGIALFIFLSLFIYLSFSFVNWQLNPHIWDIKIRGSFIFFMVINLLVTILTINTEEINK
jgi:hypothetical protein